jgi:hypothetical protein
MLKRNVRDGFAVRSQMRQAGLEASLSIRWKMLRKQFVWV